MQRGVVLTIVLFLLAVFVIRLHGFYSSAIIEIPTDSLFQIEGRINWVSQSQSFFQKFSLTTDEGKIIFVTSKSNPEYYVNQHLKIIGRFEQILLDNGKIAYTTQFPEIEARDSGYFRWIKTIQKNLIIIYSSNLPPASSSLLLGIVFGIRETMPDAVLKDLSESGIIHITAASGMNLVLIAGFIFGAFNLFLVRQKAILLSIIVIWIYAAIAGFDPSIVRASIMASVGFLALLIGRQYTALVALCFAAYIMVLIDPKLIYNIGFQLSFMSTLGLIILGYISSIESVFNENFDPGKKDKRKEGKFKIFTQDFIVTLTAQIFTLPILLIYFGKYNLFSIFANMLVLFLIPLLMALGGMLGILSLILEPIGALLILTQPFLIYILKVADIFARAPKLEISELPITIAISYYLFLASILIYFKNRKNKK